MKELINTGKALFLQMHANTCTNSPPCKLWTKYMQYSRHAGNEGILETFRKETNAYVDSAMNFACLPCVAISIKKNEKIFKRANCLYVYAFCFYLFIFFFNFLMKFRGT